MRLFFFTFLLIATFGKNALGQHDVAIARIEKAANQTLHPDSSIRLLGHVDPKSLEDSLKTEYMRIKAGAFFRKGLLDSAMISFTAALADIDSINCNRQFALVSNGLAVVLHAASLHADALTHYANALGCAEFNNDTILKFKIITNLCVLYRELGQHDRSMEYIKKAMKLLKSGEHSSRASLYNAMGQNFLAQNNRDSARHYFNQSLIYRSNSDLKGRALCLNNLGYVAALEDSLELAMEYYEQAADLRSSAGDLFGTASLFVNMAGLATQQNDHATANAFLQNALLLQQKTGSLDLVARIYAAYAQLRRAQGKHLEALDYLQLYADIKDSIFNAEAVNAIASSQYAIALKEAQNKVRRMTIQEAQNESLIARQRKINLLLAIGIAVFVGLLSLLIYQLRMLAKLRGILTEERDEATRNASQRRETLNAVVHELRTPMAAIIALADLMHIETDPSEMKRLIHLLQKSSKRLMNTTNNVLTYSRIEEGAAQLVLHEERLDELIYDLVSLLQIQAQLKGLTLTHDIQKNLIVNTDRAIVEIILMNLLGNAIKYTERGGVHVELRSTEGYVHVDVRDTGIGMTDEEQRQVFEPFYQAPGNGKIAREGSGLGLSICKYYAEIMGAELTLSSKKGEGSHFKLTFKTA